MSTKAIIRFANREDGVSFSEHPEKVRTQIYHHYDGYPEYLGCNLAEFLCDFRVVNGLPLNYFEDIKVANGMGCLAAQTVKYLKDEPGQIYLQKPRNMDWEEYEYFIWCKDGHGVWISIFDYNDNCIFVGKPDKLIEKFEYDR